MGDFIVALPAVNIIKNINQNSKIYFASQISKKIAFVRPDTIPIKKKIIGIKNRLFNVVTSNCIDPKDCTDDINDRAKIKEELESYFKYFVNENHHYNKEANYFIGFFSLLKPTLIRYLL